MAVDPQTKKVKGQFEDSILPELEITIMPYKLGRKVRLEIMNDEFAQYAKERGIIPDDLIEEISWRQAGEIMALMVATAAEFYAARKRNQEENKTEEKSG